MGLTLRGSVRNSPFGKIDVELFPLPYEDKNQWHKINSSELEALIVAYYDLIRSQESEGVVHGTPVRVRKTPLKGLRMVSFTAGFLNITLIEDQKRVGQRVMISVDLPFDGGVVTSNA